MKQLSVQLVNEEKATLKHDCSLWQIRRKECRGLNRKSFQLRLSLVVKTFLSAISWTLFFEGEK